MPQLDNPLYEQFAQLLAAGKPAAESYRLAGYRGKGSHTSAYRLKNRPEIVARVNELVAGAALVPAVSAWLNENYVMQGFKDVYRKAMEGGDLGAANTSLTAMARRLGLFVDRQQEFRIDPDPNKWPSQVRDAVMRFMVQYAFPGDPEAQHKALVIEGDAVEESTPIVAGEEIIEAQVEEPVVVEADSNIVLAEESIEVPTELIPNQFGWQDLTEDERAEAARAYSAEITKMPAGLDRQARIAWLNENCPVS